MKHVIELLKKEDKIGALKRADEKATMITKLRNDLLEDEDIKVPECCRDAHKACLMHDCNNDEKFRDKFFDAMWEDIMDAVENELKGE